ncbi:MAG: ABC transporter permease [Solirubrobacterales bacterium]|nr:ABC transporter permease [Solirubrobacterales bacterium]MBV9714350.1 ABC transporter permease [Solirubrobacterales bacterium]
MSVGAIAVAPGRVGAPRHLGIAGLILAVVAWVITLPPMLVRTAVPSAIIGVLAMLAGAIAFVGDERRLGSGAIGLGLLAIAGATGNTNSSVAHLKVVFTWSILVAAMLRYATPLLLAALGGIISERSGVINIGLEGMMLMGAFFGIWGADVLHSWVLGCLVAIASGALLALVHAWFSIHLRANQVVSGTGINFLALGITGYFFIADYGSNGTPSGISQVPGVKLPLIQHVGFFGGAIGNANLLTWIALLLVPALTVFLFRTRWGLRLRAVGEKPRAADTVGLPVLRTRYFAVVASGMLAALGGAYLSDAFVGSFNQNMTEGRGFIALAAVIFGKWRPVGALIAVLLFGFASALGDRLPTFSQSAATLFQALPYVLTLIAVAGVVGRSRAPASVGIPYVKE